jgi:hypothetical protein
MQNVLVNKQSLYNIRIEHLELLQAIEENEGELTPELEQALSLTAEAFQEKAISYGFVLKSFDNNVAIIQNEINRLTLLKQSAENKKELFKARLSEAMQEFGVEKIKTPTLSLSFRKSESVEIINEDLLPPFFKNAKIVETPDKALIKESIKAGQQVPGAQLVTKNNLQIK